MDAIRVPDHIQVRDGLTDFATYAIKEVTLGCDAYDRLRVSPGDAPIASRFGIPERHKDNPEYHWAYAYIRITQEDTNTKLGFLTAGSMYLEATLQTACELSKVRSDLATNSCVTRETVYHIYDDMMLCAENVHTYIRATQAQVQALQSQRTQHHAGFDNMLTGAAISSNTQHDQPPPTVAPHQ